MTKIIIVLLATLLAAFAWASETSPQVIERALPSNLVTDLATISTDLHSLTKAFNAYDGGMLSYLSLSKAERTLIRDLEAGTSDAEKLTDLSASDSHDILTAIEGLVPDIESTMDALTKKEPIIRKAGLTKHAVAHLKDLRAVVEKFGVELLAHTTKEVKGRGDDVLDKIMKLFDDAILRFQ